MNTQLAHTILNQPLAGNNAFLKAIEQLGKTALTELATDSVNQVADEGLDTLELLALAAKLEHFAGEVKKAAKARVITDLATYGKEGVAKAGVRLTLRETGIRYDYSRDSVWQIKNTDVETALNLRAEWEKRLDCIKVASGEPIIDPDTGEVYLAYPPVRTGREAIVATIL